MCNYSSRILNNSSSSLGKRQIKITNNTTNELSKWNVKKKLHYSLDRRTKNQKQ